MWAGERSRVPSSGKPIHLLDIGLELPALASLAGLRAPGTLPVFDLSSAGFPHTPMHKLFMWMGLWIKLRSFRPQRKHLAA